MEIEIFKIDGKTKREEDVVHYRQCVAIFDLSSRDMQAIVSKITKKFEPSFFKNNGSKREFTECLFGDDKLFFQAVYNHPEKSSYKVDKNFYQMIKTLKRLIGNN